MADFSRGKQFAAVSADTSIIDLAGGSDTDNDSISDEDVLVLDIPTAKKRRLDTENSVEASCDVEVVDLVDNDVPASTQDGSSPIDANPCDPTELDNWSRINLIIWGPTIYEDRNGQDHLFYVLIMIDAATGWFELASLKYEPTASEVQSQLYSLWLSRYPRPVEIGFDQNSDYVDVFRDVCDKMGFKPMSSSAWNKQTSSILERVQKALANSYRTFNPERTDLDPSDQFEEFLTASSSLIRSDNHTVLEDSPVRIEFGRMPVEISDHPICGNGNITKEPRATSSCSSSSSDSNAYPTKTTVGNVETIDLVDSSDEEEPGLNDRITNSNSNNCTSSTKPTNQVAQPLMLEPDDNATITHGIFERIHLISIASSNYCWTCLSSTDSAPPSSDASNPEVSGAFVSPRHIQQKDGWSCGYRNFQMMLSALLPSLRDQPQHSVFQKIPRRVPPTPISIPSVRRIQAGLKEAWNEGFDPDAARHYNLSIVGKNGKKAFIGAMEVANLFWYHGIDAVVIQFILCSESRNLLPYFLLAYFGRRTVKESTAEQATAILMAKMVLSEGEQLSNSVLTSIECLEAMLCSSANQSSNHRTSAEIPSLLPIYLQWEGHSVTVVGIEIIAPKGQNASSSLSPPSFNFLVFDPQGRHTNQTSSQQDELPTSVRLPWGRISKKDLQIVVCTDGSMSYSDRQSCKSTVGDSRLPQERVMTAAEAAVQNALLSRQR